MKTSASKNEILKRELEQLFGEQEENIETAASNFGQYIIYINKPFATHFTVFTIDYHSFDSGSFRTVRMGASHRVAQSNAGMRFTANSGNITSSSKATVYGLKQ